MKRILMVVALVLISANAFAASSIVLAPPVYESSTTDVVVIPLLCTGHTDGSFTALTPITAAIVGFDYYNRGYYLAHVWAVNSATDNHTAETVTITDATTQQLVGATAGDTLTLSATASAVSYLSASRGAAQRPVTSQLYITVSDVSGAAAVVFNLYLVLVR